ncbi:MAG: hypothetical protein KatS3mg011_1987 [Acidimicrobiia bacterium]|nr:MAG: hypothetical protein KatS3mg011_1987 [Acidimicrobiia bacterium]
MARASGVSIQTASQTAGLANSRIMGNREGQVNARRAPAMSPKPIADQVTRPITNAFPRSAPPNEARTGKRIRRYR